MYWFYLDDERGVPAGHDMILVTDYQSMIKIIDMCVQHNMEFAIDFDHDLGDPYYSGYTIAKYIVEHQIPMTKFHLHSMNPVGRMNIQQLLTHYGYEEVKW